MRFASGGGEGRRSSAAVFLFFFTLALSFSLSCLMRESRERSELTHAPCSPAPFLPFHRQLSLTSSEPCPLYEQSFSSLAYLLFFISFSSFCFLAFLLQHSDIFQLMLMEQKARVHSDVVFAVIVLSAGFIGYAFESVSSTSLSLSVCVCVMWCLKRVGERRTNASACP